MIEIVLEKVANTFSMKELGGFRYERIKGLGAKNTTEKYFKTDLTFED